MSLNVLVTLEKGNKLRPRRARISERVPLLAAAGLSHILLLRPAHLLSKKPRLYILSTVLLAIVCRDLEQHGYANACLDEFLQNKEDAAWVDGVERLPPEQRAIAVATLDKNSSSNNSNTNEDGCSPGGGPSAEGAAAAAAGSAAAPSSTISAGAKGGEQSGGGGGGGVVAAAEGTGPRLGKLQGLGGGGGGGGVVRRGAEEQGDDEGDDDDEEEDEFVDLGRHNEYLREKQV